MEGIELSDEVINSLAMSKTFKLDKTVTCLDFDDTGEYCVTAAGDEAICLYDCKYGTEKKMLYSKKYGIHLCKFAHTSNTVIHSSTKEDDTIRYLSLHDNQYIRYFRGHKQRVVTLAVSPRDDSFLSGAIDDTVRLWDLRSNNTQGCVQIQGSPIVAYDPTGKVFAIALPDHTIRLYDLRNFDRGAFSMLDNSHGFENNEVWANMKFSANGADMLITTTTNKIYVIDSYNIQPKFTLTNYQNKSGLHLEADFTPDGRYIMSGSGDGKIHFWAASDGRRVASLDRCSGPVTIAQFNPRLLMMASASSGLGFWLPVF